MRPNYDIPILVCDFNPYIGKYTPRTYYMNGQYYNALYSAANNTYYYYPI